MISRYKMPLTKKGLKMFNILIEEYGKAKARKIFYSMEHHHPDWVANWRQQ
jgi:hypothetical protein